MSVDVITFGCRLNTYESEVAKTHAEEAGLDDAVIVNTCAVTAEAVRQARQTIRRLRRERPGAKIIVTGCAAQIEPETFAVMDEADFIIGNAEKTAAETFSLIAAGRSGAGQGQRHRFGARNGPAHDCGLRHKVAGVCRSAKRLRSPLHVLRHSLWARAVPVGPPGEVVRQIRALVEEGYREVVLTGVDLTSYGSDLPGGMKLGRLVRTILKLVPELPRLRISSIDTIEADDALLDAFAEEGVSCLTFTFPFSRATT